MFLMTDQPIPKRAISQRSDRHIAHWAALGVLTLFLAIGFWYTLWNPLGEGVDEGSHFQYVRYIKETRTLPVQPTPDHPRPLHVSMGHHPPLYYLLGAFSISWIDVSDAPQVLIPNPHFVWGVDHPRNGWNVVIHTPREEWPWHGAVLAMHVLRVLTLGFGAIALWTVYSTARLLVPRMPWVAVTAMALLAFNPSFIFMSSAIHHDTLMAALYAGGLWWTVWRIDRHFSVRDSLLGGVILGAALLTKFSGLALGILFAFGFLVNAFRRRRWRSVLLEATIVYGLAFLVAGWWYIRNWIVYGDPLGWAAYKHVFWFNIRPGPFTWQTFVYEFLYQLAQTFWGAFGFMHITLPPAIWWSFWKGAALVTGIALLTIGVSHRTFLQQEIGTRWIVALMGLVVLFAAFVRHAITTAGVGHARFLFPSIAGLVTLWAIGVHALTAFRVQPLVTIALSLGMMAYSIVIPLQFVIPLYSKPEVAPGAEVAAAQPIRACFGDAACVWAGQLTPGDAEGKYRLTLYWQALPGERPDLHAHLQVRDPEGMTVVEDAFWPMPNFSAIAWDPMVVYRTHRPLQLPPGTPPGTYSIELSLTAGRDGPALPVQGRPEETFAPLMNLTLDRAVPLEISIETTRSEEMEHGIHFLGYSLGKTLYHPGETLCITLFWQSRQTVYPNLVVFVHLLDDQGNLVAQHDGVPDEGRRPTPFWQPGSVVADRHCILLSSDLLPGRYVLSVGMYDWPGLQRTRVVKGETAGSDHIPLEEIQVER